MNFHFQYSKVYQIITNVCLTLVFFLCFGISTKAQDSTSVSKPSARDFGLLIGASNVQLRVDATDYYYAATQQMISAKGDQRNGLSIGMFYNFAITPKWMIRPAVEANIANNGIVYDTGSDYNEHYSVYPIVVEAPISLVYGINQRGTIAAKGWRGLGILLAARPIIPVTLFNSSYPQTKPFSMNIDLGLTLPKALRKTIMRTELFASVNVMNMVNNGLPEDFRSNMIHDMRRHYIGLRLYFN